MIGFELETDDLVLLAPAGIINLHFPVIEGTGWGLFLDAMLKKTELTNKQDAKYKTWGDVEFVINAVEEDQPQRLDAAFDQINELVKRILLARPRKGGPVVLSTIQFPPGVGWSRELVADLTKRKLDPNEVAIQVANENITAAPQVTVGIKLAALYGFIKYLGSDLTTGRIDFLGKAPGSRLVYKLVYDEILRIDTDRPEWLPRWWTPTMRREYMGVLAQLASILISSRQMSHCDWAKYLTPLLSRTNYGNLPDFIRRSTLASDAVIVANHILNARSSLAPWKSTDLLLPACKKSPVTVEGFFAGIRNGFDTVNWGQKKDDPRWVPQVVGPRSNCGWGLVFELRGIAEGLPFKDWRTFAKKHVPFFATLNGEAKTATGVSTEVYGLIYNVNWRWRPGLDGGRPSSPNDGWRASQPKPERLDWLDLAPPSAPSLSSRRDELRPRPPETQPTVPSGVRASGSAEELAARLHEPALEAWLQGNRSGAVYRASDGGRWRIELQEGMEAVYTLQRL